MLKIADGAGILIKLERQTTRAMHKMAHPLPVLCPRCNGLNHDGAEHISGRGLVVRLIDVANVLVSPSTRGQ